jgi:hypothetical protein
MPVGGNCDETNSKLELTESPGSISLVLELLYRWRLASLPVHFSKRVQARDTVECKEGNCRARVRRELLRHEVH